MLLADSSFWFAAALDTHVFHSQAKSWLLRRSRRDSIAFCRQTQLSMLRLLTTTAVTALYGLPPLSNAAAWSVYEGFFSNKQVTFLEQPAELDPHLKRLVKRPTASPKLWMDAYLAAFAIAGGYRLLTTDTGFRQFAGLDLVLIGE